VGDGKRPAACAGFLRHYIRDIVFAANDGLITTFAVVAGVRGADLGALVVLALGFANPAADGIAMGVGNYLGIKSERAAELGRAFRERDETLHAMRHGAVTWSAFVLAGLIPLLPFFGGGTTTDRFPLSLFLTAASLFSVGAARTVVTRQSWWKSGLEMLLIGALAGGAAFLAGWIVERLTGTGGAGGA